MAVLQPGQRESSAEAQQRFYHPIQSLIKDRDHRFLIRPPIWIAACFVAKHLFIVLVLRFYLLEEGNHAGRQRGGALRRWNLYYLNSAQELRDSHIETLGQNFQGPQSGFFLPCFQIGDVWPANAGMRGQVVLVPTPAFPQPL